VLSVGAGSFPTVVIIIVSYYCNVKKKHCHIIRYTYDRNNLSGCRLGEVNDNSSSNNDISNNRTNNRSKIFGKMCMPSGIQYIVNNINGRTGVVNICSVIKSEKMAKFVLWDKADGEVPLFFGSH